MNEVMTIAEIHEHFPSEWVLIRDPQTDQNHQIQSGTLVWHSKDREEVDRKAVELAAPKDIAVLYTGSVPTPGTAIIL